ncbi:MAG: polysaccharide biosynthesis protein, partial [Planctomycetota bacterium]
GGSIGSLIASIVASFQPERLLLMERAENNLFEIDRDLNDRYPDLPRHAILHDVTDARRTADIVAEYRPHVIFHAAAHKHVPMMEDHPRQAVLNNFFGTKSIADAAHAAGAERFVMISSDKAVNPTSVMGATKRTAELYVQHLAQRSGAHCSMVRFGNVLGSACSVVPIWSQQLAQGGPLTVTDPRMTRYFMTIPEAASLVIQAASLEQQGAPIFVLDMGQPIRILDMAERFIKLHGLEPHRDVHITITGARPGEKLHEELQYDSEDIAPTTHHMVRRLKTTPPSPRRVAWMTQTFSDLIQNDDPAPILEALRRAVPQMQNTKADGETERAA